MSVSARVRGFGFNEVENGEVVRPNTLPMTTDPGAVDKPGPRGRERV